MKARRGETLLLTDTCLKLRTSVKTWGGDHRGKPCPRGQVIQRPRPLLSKREDQNRKQKREDRPSVCVRLRQTDRYQSEERGGRLLPLPYMGGAGREVLAAVADATSQTV